MLRTLRTRWLMPLGVWASAGDGVRCSSLDMASSLITVSRMALTGPASSAGGGPGGTVRWYRVSRSWQSSRQGLAAPAFAHRELRYLLTPERRELPDRSAQRHDRAHRHVPGHAHHLLDLRLL